MTLNHLSGYRRQPQMKVLPNANEDDQHHEIPEDDDNAAISGVQDKEDYTIQSAKEGSDQ